MRLHSCELLLLDSDLVCYQIKLTLNLRYVEFQCLLVPVNYCYEIFDYGVRNTLHRWKPPETAADPLEVIDCDFELIG